MGPPVMRAIPQPTGGSSARGGACGRRRGPPPRGCTAPQPTAAKPILESIFLGPQTIDGPPAMTCRRWFQVDPRLKERQYACSSATCQARRQQTNVEAWLERYPGYLRGRTDKHRLYRRDHAEAQKRWRASHPEARERENRARAERRKRAQVRSAVEQEAIALELHGGEQVAAGLSPAVDQKSMRAQLNILVGVASQLLPAVEHKPIAGALTKWHDRGRQLIGGCDTHAKTRKG